MNREYYTDGACSVNTRQGGYAVVHFEDNGKAHVFWRHSTDTTNNRMELCAFYDALRHIFVGYANHPDDTYTIYTDSAYIANCINQRWYATWLSNGWKTAARTPVVNQDLWTHILEMWRRLKELNVTPQVVAVKGHDTNKYNNLADKYAVFAKKTQTDGETIETI